MPGQGQTFGFGGSRDTILATAINHPHGKPVVQEGQSGLGSGQSVPLAARFWGVTGSTAVPDVTFNQAAAVNLFPTGYRVPSNMRCYVDYMRFSLIGATAWTRTSGTNVGIVVTDTSAALLPVAYVPFAALVPGAVLDFPENAVVTPFIFGSGQTITATYLASGPTLTLASGTVVTTTMANLYVTVIADATTPASVGQSMMIASQASTTVLTLSNAFTVAPSTAAIYAIGYFVASAGGGTGTTATIPAAASLAAHQLQNGSYVAVANGTGAGQASLVSDNTTTVITTGTLATQLASGSIMKLTTNPGNLGLEFGIGNSSMQLTLGAGLQAALVGVPAAGSAVRIQYGGYFAP